MDPDGGAPAATPRGTSRAIELDGGEVPPPRTRRRNALATTNPRACRHAPSTARPPIPLACSPQVIDSSNHANVRTWSFKRAGKRNNKQIEEASAPDGTVKVYFLDGSHKLFDSAAKSVGDLLNEVKTRLSVAESNAFALYQAPPLTHALAHLLPTPSQAPAPLPHRTPHHPPWHALTPPPPAATLPPRRTRCSAARTTSSTRTRSSTRSARASTAAPSRSA